MKIFLLRTSEPEVQRPHDENPSLEVQILKVKILSDCGTFITSLCYLYCLLALSPEQLAA